MENGKYVLRNSFTAHSAYEMVKELNGKLKLGIVDFGLGNEFEQWHETHDSIWHKPEEGISADEYIAKFIEFAIAIRKAQEEVNGNPNSIKIWGPEVTGSWMDWNTSNFEKDCQWSDTVRGQVNCSYGNGSFDHFVPYFLYRLSIAEKDKTVNPRKYKLLDYFALHYYPNFRTKIDVIDSVIRGADGKQQVANILASTQVLNNPTFINTIDISSYRNFAPNILGRMNGWISAFYPNVKLAINEFAIDSDYRCVDNYHPIIRPLYLADVIGIAIKEKVSFFNNFILSSADQVKDPWTMLNNETERTSIFHMYKMYSANFKGNVLKVEDNMGDIVNAYATVSDKIINLAIVNKEPIEKAIQIYYKKGNSVQKSVTYKAPAWSTSMLKLKVKADPSKSFEINQYGAKEMGIIIDKTYSKIRQ
ncbi:MAG: glycoside hydrolase family 44 protein [Bacteriovoracaceae bacterium]